MLSVAMARPVCCDSPETQIWCLFRYSCSETQHKVKKKRKETNLDKFKQFLFWAVGYKSANILILKQTCRVLPYKVIFRIPFITHCLPMGRKAPVNCMEMVPLAGWIKDYNWLPAWHPLFRICHSQWLQCSDKRHNLLPHYGTITHYRLCNI